MDPFKTEQVLKARLITLLENLFRKKGLMLNTVFGIVGGLLMALSKPAGSYEMIIVGRLIIGFCCGQLISILFY